MNKEVEQTPEQVEEEIERYQRKMADLDARLDEFRSKKLDDTKAAMMRNAGYTDDQIERYKGHVIGGDTKELSEALADFRQEIPPATKYVDPNPMNGERQKPAQKSGEDIGREIYQRIKHKLRRF